jgi:hypothetical protein
VVHRAGRSTPKISNELGSLVSEKTASFFAAASIDAPKKDRGESQGDRHHSARCARHRHIAGISDIGEVSAAPPGRIGTAGKKAAGGGNCVEGVAAPTADFANYADADPAPTR